MVEKLSEEAAVKQSSESLINNTNNIVGEQPMGQLEFNDLVFGASFARIVSVLMQSPHYKHYALSDLEWLVAPPLLSSQFAVLDAVVEGIALPVPVAVALWAFVSIDVDRRLSEKPALPVRLRPDEWQSGDIAWLIDVIGDDRATPILKAQLLDGPLKGLTVKMRSTKQDGTVVVDNYRTSELA